MCFNPLEFMTNTYAFLLLVLLGFLITPNRSCGQTSLDYAYLNYTLLPTADFKEAANGTSLSHLEMNLLTPTLQLSKKTKVNSVLYYRFSSYNYDFETSYLPSQLHEIRYTFLTRHTFNSNWELLFVPRCNIRSDFKEQMSLKDFFPAASAILMKSSQKDAHFKWGFGVNYNNDLDKNSVLPILALNYTNQNVRLSAFLPNNASIAFLSTKKIEYGLAFQSDPVIIHNQSTDSVSYLKTLNVHCSATFSYNIGANIWLNSKAGWVGFRNYDVLDASFQTPNDAFDSELSSSAFVQLGLSLRSKE